MDSIIDVQHLWLAYMSAIRSYALGVTSGRSNMDLPMRAVVEENLQRVDLALQRLHPPGVVTKLKLPQKASNAALWRELDKRLRERAESRQPGRKPWPLPLEATKDAFRRNDVEAFLQCDGKYDRTRNADVHHIWPETLGGPTVGWNLVPLPPLTHHDVLHPILDRIVRESAQGRRFRLI